ncbi:MAG TPA: hypothetical protein VHK26_14745 [Methyloceanibacter sp.]|jgi:hypothetical protein|nr:hypothetical protein [Methyloceanibacter sp.]
MDDWDNFYMLAGSTGGTLIGIIFVVITLGMEHAQKGDALRVRIFVTPILVYFASLLVIAMVMVPPMPNLVRAVALGVIGCAGFVYVLQLAYLSRHEAKTDEQEFYLGRVAAAHRLRPHRSGGAGLGHRRMVCQHA